MNTSLYILCIFLLASGIVGSLLRKKRTEERRKICQLVKKVEAALEDRPPSGQQPAFAASLSQAAITTKLQKSRIRLQSGAGSGPPEKYTFISNLVARGMNAEEISEILDISTTEASQLVHLCSLNGYHNPTPPSQEERSERLSEHFQGGLSI